MLSPLFVYLCPLALYSSRVMLTIIVASFLFCHSLFADSSSAHSVSPLAKPYLSEIESKRDGAIAIGNGYSALFHRLSLIDMAVASIDIQVYVYKDDFASQLLLHYLQKAARRGVKIRILIDDNGVDGDLRDMAMLDNEENVDVKIFNPYYFRHKMLRLLELPFNFHRINKRMHNKMFLFDDIALIVGGRNVGNNYFDLSDVNFTDLDVLFVGNVASGAKDNFNEFWDYVRSVPLSTFVSISDGRNHRIRLDIPQPLLFELEEYASRFRSDYETGAIDVIWGDAMFLADRPHKIDMVPHEVDPLILDTIAFYLNKARDSIEISSAYLVPGPANADLWKMLASRDVKISILTNSLSSTDVVPVYSHWEKYRKILQEGSGAATINIYEYANSLPKAKLKDKVKFNAKRAKVSLHSKSIVIDNHLVAVGSFNLDYRSSNINTENMVFFASRDFATRLSNMLMSQMLDSYRIRYIDGRCHWEKLDDGEVSGVYKRPPNTSIWLRMYKNAVRIVPEKEL